MRMRWVGLTLFALVGSVITTTATRAATPVEVDAALSRAKAFMYSLHKPGTHWERVNARDPAKGWADLEGGGFGGLTALTTYALLASGESPTDPRLAAAIEFLRKLEMVSVYPLGMRAQVWPFLPPTPENKAAIKRDAQLLMQGMQKKGPALGTYDYMITMPSSRIDLSNSQYGVLGVWASEQTGATEVPVTYWQQVESAWLKLQQSDGGWAYEGIPRGDHPVTLSMTAAGVATLFITQDYTRVADGLGCSGNIRNDHIDRGMVYIGQHFDEALRESQYTLYGIERIGVAGGYKYINGIDWYQTGADYLIKTQQPDGAWVGRWHGAPAETPFGMLFLARGRAPIVMNKLQYGEPDAGKAPAVDAAKKPVTRTKGPAWNQRPRDAANITRWIGRQAERDLNWQIVNLDAPAGEMNDAPILYIAGSEAPIFTDEHRAKLKAYVENGGMIVANADCGGTGFTTAMRKLAGELFAPREFRELPATHVLYTGEQFHRKSWKTKPSVMSLSNGVRELFVLIPQADPAKAWQTQAAKGKEELFQLMANLFLYAVDKQGLQVKGQSYLVHAKPDAKPTSTIKLARLQYDGDWDPEPGGWRRLVAILLNDHSIGLDVQAVKPAAGSLKGFAIAHLTGTVKFRLTEAQRAEIKSFVADGGTLIVDAAGGSGEFAESMDAELTAMFPKEAAALANPLPPAHVIYARAESPIKKIGYRNFARGKVTGELTAGRLRAMQIGGRDAVIVSREDLSAGLVGNQVDGVVGYDPQTATAIMSNIILGITESK